MGFILFLLQICFFFSELNHSAKITADNPTCLIWRQGRKNAQKNFFKLLFRQPSVENLDRQKNHFVTV